MPLSFIGAMFFAVGVALAAMPAFDAEYAGLEQCRGCHEAAALSYGASLHGQKGFALQSNLACEACHGPGSEHVAGGGDATKIFSFARGPKAPGNAACLQCHEQGAVMLFAGSLHDARGVSCTDCHRIHYPGQGAQLLKAKDEVSLCLKCHHRARSALMKSSHHPLREGKMTCSDCHNPHGSVAENLVAADSLNDKCYECHREKRGPFLWDHVPVREECTHCHDPHGSNHPRLLAARVPYLCQRCHSEPRHPGTLYDESNVNTRAIYNRACLNCHSTIHGSNHPSGQTFTR